MHKELIESDNARTIDDLLTYLACINIETLPPTVGNFRNALPALPSQFAQMKATLIEHMGGYNSETLHALVGKVQMVNFNGIFDPEDVNIKMLLVQCREIWGPKKERLLAVANSKLKYAITDREYSYFNNSKRIVAWHSIPIDYNGNIKSITRALMMYHRKNWIILNEEVENKLGMSPPSLIDIGLLFQAASKYRWSVEIGYNGLPVSISFLTDPTGVKEFFKLRDIPEGKMRRAALSHWVSAHWRQVRVDPVAEVYVRQHLRGKTEFRWFDMDVKIHIPESDKDKINRLKRERQRMKILGLDRRGAW